MEAGLAVVWATGALRINSPPNSGQLTTHQLAPLSPAPSCRGAVDSPPALTKIQRNSDFPHIVAGTSCRGAVESRPALSKCLTFPKDVFHLDYFIFVKRILFSRICRKTLFKSSIRIQIFIVIMTSLQVELLEPLSLSPGILRWRGCFGAWSDVLPVSLLNVLQCLRVS